MSKIIMLFVILLILTYNLYSIERFQTSTDMFFILQNKTSDAMTMKTIPVDAKIGYTQPLQITMFKTIYKQHNCDKEHSFEYMDLNDNDPLEMDIILSIGHHVDFERYKMIDYFKKNKRILNYEYVVYNDNNTSTLVLSMRRIVRPFGKPKIRPKISVGKQHHFVIEDGVDGLYSEKDLTTNVINFHKKTIDGMEVQIGDKVLFKNQHHPFINGEYEVTNTQLGVEVTRSNILLTPKEYSCMDEDLFEVPQHTTESSCEHPLTVDGKVKDKRHTWDSRCRRNMECPFFDQNYNYICNDNGFCEMPDTVTQISFKKYINNNECV